MRDSVLVDVVIVASAVAAMGLLSYYDVPKKRHRLIPEETRVSRAVSDAYAYALVIVGAIAGGRIGDARHAPHLFLVAGVLSGALLAVLTRDRLGRVLAAAPRDR